jgi:hypothetical protein
MLVIVTFWGGATVFMLLPSRNEISTVSWLERSFGLVLVALLYGGWILSRTFWPHYQIITAVIVLVLLNLVPIAQRLLGVLLKRLRGD